MSRHFDGSTTYFSIADDAALTFPDGNWSMGGWIRMLDLAGTGGQYFFSNGGWSEAHCINCFVYELSHANAGKVGMFIEDDATKTVWIESSSTPGTSTAWFHYLIVRTDDTFKLYDDGAEVASGTTAGISLSNSPHDPMLGRRQSNPDYNCCCDMAEWAKWDVALDSEQRAALAAGVRPPEVGTRPAWYLPMLAGLEEEIAALAVTNYGTTVSEHPPKIVPAGQYI